MILFMRMAGLFFILVGSIITLWGSPLLTTTGMPEAFFLHTTGIILITIALSILIQEERGTHPIYFLSLYASGGLSFVVGFVALMGDPMMFNIFEPFRFHLIGVGMAAGGSMYLAIANRQHKKYLFRKKR